ncbi:MAG: hypothetical protein ACK5KM_02360 [Hyphomicrobiaceae bacterium]
MVLMTLINFDGPLGWALLLAPLATLVAVVVFVTARRDRIERREHVVGDPASLLFSGPQPAFSQNTASPPTAASSTSSPSTSQMRGLDAMPRVAGANMAETAQVGGHAPWEASTSLSDSAGQDDVNRVTAWLAQAEQRFDDGAVARHALELARVLVANGRSGSEVQDHLRRAIILSTRLEDHATHAAARLELGDLLGSDGDMTTACEHWQIARQIYWNGSDKEAVADVDRRMTANGCPTDWVLTDF